MAAVPHDFYVFQSWALLDAQGGQACRFLVGTGSQAPVTIEPCLYQPWALLEACTGQIRRFCME